VRFDLAGPGKMIGVGNGDPSSHERDVFLPPMDWRRSLFNGLAQIIVQSSQAPGEITLSAKA
jgi:beta-galactosidase